MLFVLQTPSLQRLAAVKIVAHLWSQPDIITRMATSFHGLAHDDITEYTTQWQEIEKKVQSNASALPMPGPCKKELSDVIKPIGVEIVVWCQYHNLDNYPFNFLDKLFPPQFCWTMLGTLDYGKTAELIVKDERVDVERRFEVACLNCLEDAARQLFQFLPNNRMHKYISEAVGYEIMNPRILIAYFICAFNGDEDQLDRLFQAMDLGGVSVNQHLFIVVLCEGNRATCEYFFRKVSQAEREQVFEEWEILGHNRDQESPSCSLIFCLSRMNDEQREGLFREYIRCVLIWLLRWPMPSLFLEAAKRGWQLMDDHDCAEMLGDIIFKFNDGFQDYDYAQWFRELWRLSTAEHKQHYFNEIGHLKDLFATKRTEFIQLGLNRAPSQQLREVVENKDIYERISRVLMDESAISETALMECKKKAALKSSKDRDNVENRLRSEYVSRLVDLVMERRIKSREKARLATS